MSRKTRTALSRTILHASSALALGAICALSACSTLPETRIEKFSYPKAAYIEPVDRPYTHVGYVKSRADYVSLNDKYDEDLLCRNYYNKAVADLVKRAKEHGADAVIDVRSVVFFEDGKMEKHKTPECSDDGAEGQILVMGTAVKWKKDAPPNERVMETEIGSEPAREPASAPEEQKEPQKKAEPERKHRRYSPAIAPQSRSGWE